MTQIPRLDPIKYLLLRKFGDQSLIVPGEFEAATNEAALARKIREYTEYLEALPEYRLSKLFKEEQARALFDEHRFNLPSAQADFEHWSMMPHWTLDEAIALSFGKSPEKINWLKVKGSVERSTFASQYSRRRELALRAAVSNQLTDPVLPSVFLAWCKRVGIAVPAELEAVAEGKGLPTSDWKALYDSLQASFDEKQAHWTQIAKLKDEVVEQLRRDLQEMQSRLDASQSATVQSTSEKPLGTLARQSLLKMVIGMALAKYGYDL